MHSAAHEIMLNHLDDEGALDEVMLRIWWGRMDSDVLTANGLRYLMKAIRKSRNPRYYDTMNIIAHEAKDKRVRRQAKKYIKKTTRSEGQYTPELVHKN